MARSPGKSSHAKRDGKSDAEDVYHHADNHHLQGKRTLGGSGERHHDTVHEEIDRHAVERARNDRVLYKERNSAARRKKDRSRSICDDEMTKEAKQCRCESSLECLWSQESTGN